MPEIGEINNFKKYKQLLAYLGIDPSVNESGKFKGDRNKMPKRGSRIARRVLCSVSIAIDAIMYKLVNYIFAVLRDQKKYKERLPEIHCQMFKKFFLINT